ENTMNRLLLLLTTLIVSFVILSGCSSAKDSNYEENDRQKEEINNQFSDEQIKDKNKENENEESTEETTDENIIDQKDLKIGDTGQIESTLGKYEITIDSIKKEDEIDGRAPQADYFFVTDVTIKNIGDSSIEAEDAKGNLEIT